MLQTQVSIPASSAHPGELVAAQHGPVGPPAPSQTSAWQVFSQLPPPLPQP